MNIKSDYSTLTNVLENRNVEEINKQENILEIKNN